MNILKRLELEWKILILACLVFLAFAWPIQTLFISRLTNTLQQSVDPHLEPILRQKLEQADDLEREAIIASLKRNRQWKVLLPIIIKEQQTAILVFSFGLFCLLFVIALWTLKRLTKPLKNLALSVERIGKGERASLRHGSGGALGTVEKAVLALSEELDILREKARVQGMETAWQDIARVMAHEIKNPLTPIRLTLDRMEERALEGENVSGKNLKKFLSRINSQVDTLERLVNQFRSFSRDPEVHLKKICLADIISSVADGLSAKIKTSITGSESIISDSYLLNQIFLNLWKNALEAGANTIEVEISKNSDDINLSIKDNGPGLPKKDLERVWLPYVTMKKGGTGLGLPVVKKLIETLNGQVTLATKTIGNNRGLTVNISLPLYPKENING